MSDNKKITFISDEDLKDLILTLQAMEEDGLADEVASDYVSIEQVIKQATEDMMETERLRRGALEESDFVYKVNERDEAIIQALNTLYGESS